MMSEMREDTHLENQIELLQEQPLFLGKLEATKTLLARFSMLEKCY